MTSTGIETFLNYIREVEQRNRMASEVEKEANDATQDILHAVEFETYDKKKPAKLVKSLHSVRQKRREAKETIEITQPIVQWVNENRATIKGLERLLGDVRKAERRTQNRSYAPRTDILEEAKQ